jgi:hypothetical protein
MGDRPASDYVRIGSLDGYFLGAQQSRNVGGLPRLARCACPLRACLLINELNPERISGTP